MAIPIWQDHYITLGNGSQYDYRIVLDDLSEVIYTGRAYLRPSASEVRVKVNDILADYLSTALPSMDDSDFTRLSFPLSFTIQYDDNGVWTDAETFEVYKNWSYEYGFDPAVSGLSAPINGRASAIMPFVMSVWEADSVRMNVYYKDGTSSFRIVPIATQENFSDDFSDDFALSLQSAGSGSICFDLSRWDNVDHIEVGGHTFKVVEGCTARYGLYYENAYGGWDFLVCDSRPGVMRDELTRHTFEKDYDNNDPSQGAKDNYCNEIARHLVLRTGWLTDDEASRMHHLLNSTSVYVYDTMDGTMRPVVITDNTTEYKRSKEQGSPVMYTINCEYSAIMTRR